jgi:carbamoyltransferase
MNVLGIYGGLSWDANVTKSNLGHGDFESWVHESGASLFIDGKHIRSGQEERFSRIKYDGNFPISSIYYCLDGTGLKFEDIDWVVIPGMCIPIFYSQINNDGVLKELKEMFPNAKIKVLSHHLCHAASSVFTSEFNEGSFITLDGGGSMLRGINNKSFTKESNTIGYFNKKERKLTMFNQSEHVNRFGTTYLFWSYRIYTQKMNLNVKIYDEKYRETYPGKVMGMCAYGKVDDIENYKIYRMSDLDYEEMPYVIFEEDKIWHEKSPEDKAFILQKNFEGALVDYIGALKRTDYIDDNVCFAGGVMLNVLGNSAIKNSGIIKNMHIPPFTGDCGLCFGAAAYWAFKLGYDIEVPENIGLLGIEYSEKDIESVIKGSWGVEYQRYDEDELLTKTAEYLNRNEIVAWFQGKSEFGPRALGSRSLLMSPVKKENKDILNEKVKHREEWRPFAGTILEEKLGEYFEEPYSSPYMLYSLTVKCDKMDEISAITHEDKTCRIQTVNEKQNPRMTKLLKEFEKVSGVPVVLNTSFNDNGEPIVETPRNALESFKRMNVDCLVIGNFIVRKT